MTCVHLVPIFTLTPTAPSFCFPSPSLSIRFETLFCSAQSQTAIEECRRMSLDLDDRAMMSSAAAVNGVDDDPNGIGDVEEKTLQLKLEGKK